MAIVYQHIRKDNGQVFYIGVGTSKARAYQVYKDDRSEKWKRIAMKYGYSVQITHSEICREEACSIEKYLIDFWRGFLGRDAIANITDGGDGMLGYKHSEATRKYLSELKKTRPTTLEALEKIRQKAIGRKHTPEARLKISLGNKGRVNSVESIEKMRKAKLGKKASEKTKLLWSKQRSGGGNSRAKKIININTNEIFSCIIDAVKNSGKSKSYLCLRLYGKVPNNTPYRYLNS